MTRYIYILIALQTPFGAFSQKLTDEQLLEKAITYHDPNDNWSSLQTEQPLIISKPTVVEHTTKVLRAFPEQFYSAVVNQDGNTLTSTLKKENCTLLLTVVQIFQKQSETVFALLVIGQNDAGLLHLCIRVLLCMM